MELIPDRGHYRTGDPVVIELSAPAPSDNTVVVTRLTEVIRTVPVAAEATQIDLGRFEKGGYGVHYAGTRTAFDVLEGAFSRPRYGFVAALGQDLDIEAITRNFRRMHLNLMQFYDWAYRHSRLLPPDSTYTDPLGMERDLGVINRLAKAFHDRGTVPLGYSAVYAVGAEELDQWNSATLLRGDGEPYRLGEDFLVLVDPAEPVWLEHYLGQLQGVLVATELRGFHLDQYGWPKFADRADGTRIDLAESFVTLLRAIRERMPKSSFLFNNVNDFPTWATAASPQDATYIEVWEPHGTLQDLASLATNALAHRPEHPPILSAYLSCYAGREDEANRAAELVMATAWSHGASHLLLGESGNALTDPYYPRNHPLHPESLERFARWYDFAVRYGDLLFEGHGQDVTESFTGGINEDVTFSGAAFSTQATPGSVWTRVVQTSQGLVIHLINLVSQTETTWDRGKNPVHTQAGVRVGLALVREAAPLYFADVDNPDMMKLPCLGTEAAAQSDSLSAGQGSVMYSLPPVGTWALLFLPAAAYAARETAVHDTAPAT